MPGKKRARGSKASVGDRASKKVKKARPEQVPLPQDELNAEIEVENADVQFVDEFKGSLGFLESLNAKQLNKQAQIGPAKPRAKHTASPSDTDSDQQGPEAAYERAPRHRLQEQQSSHKSGLPTKNLHGELVYAKAKSSKPGVASIQVPRVDGITVLDDGTAAQDDQASDSDSSVGTSDLDSTAGSDKDTRAVTVSRPHGKQIQGQQQLQQDDDLQDFQNIQERREEIKQQMAVTASKVLQNPEANLPSMRSLLALAADKDSQVARLAMLSLLAVFKDILPGYRIRLPTEKELEIPVSKEVKQTRDYEAMQLNLYQAYLKLLLPVIGSNAKPAQSSTEARVAARCMCGLLTALHHFNYAADLLQAVVPLMVSKDAQLRQLSFDAIREVLMNDEEGKVAVEAVQLVADLIKRRKCSCPAEVVRTLLVLKLKDADPQAMNKGKKKGVKTKGKSKKSRRADEVERAFQEAEASADRAAARSTQSQMLLALFEVFFRVLKQCTQSGVQAQQAQGYKLTPASAHKRFPLLMATLDGLTKYAHLISVEYFADLLQVMQHIMQMSAFPLQHRLRTLLTASDILRGQGEALNIDRRDMYARLYACIPELALMPIQSDDSSLDDLLSPDMGSGPSTSEPAASAERPQAVVLLSIAQQMLLDQGKLLDTARLAAFTKSLSCVSLHLESGAALGNLSLVNRLLRHNMKLRCLLEHESGAPPPAWAAAGLAGITETDTALTGAPLWELALLHRHYHPHLSQAAAAVAVIPPQGGGGAGSHSALASAMEPATLAHTYITDKGTFKPAPQPPRKAPTAPKHPKLPDFAQLSEQQAEAELVQSLDRHACAAEAVQSSGQVGAEVTDEEVGTVLQQWFREQKRFQQNVALRQQHARLQRMVAQLQKHLSGRDGEANAVTHQVSQRRH